MSNGSAVALEAEDDMEDTSKLHDPKWWKLRCPCSNFGKLVYLGISFLVLFSPFQATQILVSSIYPNDGLISLFGIYATYTISAFLAPLFVELVGLNASMFFASLLYTLWLGGVASGINWLYITVSFINGFGGGPIWVSQGAYIQRVAGMDNQGRYNGIFFALFFCSVIIGNIITGSLFFALTPDTDNLTNSTTPISPLAPSDTPVAPPGGSGALGSSTSLVLWAMFAIGCLGSLTFLFLPPVTTVVGMAPAAKAKRTLRAFIEPRSLWITPYFINSGTSVSFAWGSFPRLMPLRWVPFVTAVYGVALFIASMGIGPVFDRYGWRPVLILHLIAIFIGYPLIVIADHFQEIGIFFAASFMLGLIEAFSMNLSSSLVIKIYGDESAVGFSLFRMWSGLGIAIMFLVALGLQWVPMLLVLAFIALVSSILLAVYLSKVRGE